jgi:hypothetical protein
VKPDYTYALFELAAALRDYANEIEERGSTNPNHNQPSTGHLIRSRCLEKSAAFWENIAQVNDGARMKLLCEFFKFNQNVHLFFELHSAMHVPAPTGGNRPPSLSYGTSPSAGLADPHGSHLHHLSPHHVGDAVRCSLSLASLPKYSFGTPQSTIRPKPATQTSHPVVGESAEDPQIRIDNNFRALEDGFLRSFVVDGTTNGSKKLREVIEGIQRLGFGGLKDCAALLEIDLSCQVSSSQDEKKLRSPSSGTVEPNQNRVSDDEHLSAETNYFCLRDATNHHHQFLASRRRYRSEEFQIPELDSDLTNRNRIRGKEKAGPRLTCPYFSGLNVEALFSDLYPINAGLKVANLELLVDLIKKTENNKKNKGYSCMAPFPSSIKNIVGFTKEPSTVTTKPNVSVSRNGYEDPFPKNDKESTAQSTIGQDDERLWGRERARPGILHMDSCQKIPDESFKEFRPMHHYPTSKLGNGWKNIRVGFKPSIVPREIFEAEIMKLIPVGHTVIQRVPGARMSRTGNFVKENGAFRIIPAKAGNPQWRANLMPESKSCFMNRIDLRVHQRGDFGIESPDVTCVPSSALPSGVYSTSSSMETHCHSISDLPD